MRMISYDRLSELDNAIDEIRALVEDLPSGIDYNADPDDETPEDMTAHIGGLIWQICERVCPTGAGED